MWKLAIFTVFAFREPRQSRIVDLKALSRWQPPHLAQRGAESKAQSSNQLHSRRILFVERVQLCPAARTQARQGPASLSSPQHQLRVANGTQGMTYGYIVVVSNRCKVCVVWRGRRLCRAKRNTPAHSDSHAGANA